MLSQTRAMFFPPNLIEARTDPFRRSVPGRIGPDSRRESGLFQRTPGRKEIMAGKAPRRFLELIEARTDPLRRSVPGSEVSYSGSCGRDFPRYRFRVSLSSGWPVPRFGLWRGDRPAPAFHGHYNCPRSPYSRRRLCRNTPKPA